MKRRGNDVLSQARLEVRRCQRNIDAGGDRAFWMRRLERAAKDYEAASAILRMQIAAMGGETNPQGAGARVTDAGGEWSVLRRVHRRTKDVRGLDQIADRAVREARTGAEAAPVSPCSRCGHPVDAHPEFLTNDPEWGCDTEGCSCRGWEP